MAARLTIVVPVLNEARGLADSLRALAPLRQRGHEVIVVDGGSDDASAALAAPFADRVLHAPRGRAVQMNAGARAAGGEAIVFLHADTRLPGRADESIFEGLKDHAWGRFDIDIEGRHPMLRVVAAAMNLRSRLTGIATGDQAIFVRRADFPGFPEIALMEDIALSRMLKRAGPPACLRDRARTSGRRWESHGVLRTVLLMWRLRALYWLGVDPERLARRY
jgi:rSAM/selenodomain-associated transferase 2